MPTNKAYPFKSVNIGDIFSYNNDCYMKIETATADYARGSYSTQVNAVNLKNG